MLLEDCQFDRNGNLCLAVCKLPVAWMHYRYKLSSQPGAAVTPPLAGHIAPVRRTPPVRLTRLATGAASVEVILLIRSLLSMGSMTHCWQFAPITRLAVSYQVGFVPNSMYTLVGLYHWYIRAGRTQVPR